MADQDCAIEYLDAVRPAARQRAAADLEGLLPPPVLPGAWALVKTAGQANV